MTTTAAMKIRLSKSDIRHIGPLPMLSDRNRSDLKAIDAVMRGVSVEVSET